MGKPPGFRVSNLIARNLASRPYRNIATIFIFAIIAGMFFSSQYLMSGAQQSLDTGISRMGADILVVPEEYAGAGQTIILTGTPTNFFFEGSGFEKISGIKGVSKAAPQIYIATLFASCCAAPVQMIAIDPERDFTVSTWLKENPGVTLGKDDIIIGSAVIQDVGKDLIFYGHTFHVVGVLERTGMGIDNAVFTRFEDAYVMADESGVKAVKKLTIPQGKVSAVLVKVDPGTSPAEVASEITASVPGTKTILPEGLINAVSRQLGATTRFLYLSALAVTVMSIPLLALISVLVTNERRREVSILRVLGATKVFVVFLMLAESASLAIIGGLIGIGSAAGALILFQDFIMVTLKIPFIIPNPFALLAHGGSALLLSIVVAGIASLYPAVIIVKSEPYEAIRGEEL
ncbi:MAG: FtsX-like permease family protein [Methanomicrobiales archaeon]